MRVLIAEDNPETVALLRTALEHASFDHVIATTGLEALALYRKAITDGQPFDLLVFDIAMPLQTGRQALAALRSEGDNIPAVLVTALTGAEADAVALNAKLWTKPEAYYGFVEKVERELSSIQ